MKTFINTFCLAAGIVVLASCGNNPKKDAQEICDCFSKANAISEEDAKRVHEQDKCSDLQLKKFERYKTQADQKAFNDALSDCGQQLIEHALEEHLAD